ncbi:hypothetical protein SAY86_010064 [Trapa natans]|uniref:RING-type E3 ubiquitin transferase n=1 Tax=Trapa natans TaxID=22666 RepID=A0AAN7QQ54_TRANT|nr:hypothetical protein SAY86_010064 [Trapa natans]
MEEAHKSSDHPPNPAEPCTTLHDSRCTGQNIDSYGPDYTLNAKVIIFSVIIMFLVIIIVLGLHTYEWWLRHCLCGRRRRGHRRQIQSRYHYRTAALHPGGLDASVLKSLPTFIFDGGAGKDEKDGLGDCPVCLSEFEAGEAGRALPKCGHAFHVECIDMWFQTHSNCPICRSPVQAQSGKKAELAGATAAATQPLSHGSNEGEYSSLNVAPPAELVVVTIEVPPSIEERFMGSREELGSGSEGGGGGNQPKTRDPSTIMDLKFGFQVLRTRVTSLANRSWVLDPDSSKVTGTKFELGPVL